MEEDAGNRISSSHSSSSHVPCVYKYTSDPIDAPVQEKGQNWTQVLN